MADKTNLSKGTVYNIIKKWKHQLGEGNIDEVRKFRKSLRKSGFTIEDCALGFRMIRMLDKFNLHDDFEKPLIDLASDESVHEENTNYSDLEEFSSHFVTKESQDKDNLINRSNQILSFLVEIYEQCRTNNIKSADIIEWIKDLLNNFSHTEISENIAGGNNGKSNLFYEDKLIDIPLITRINTFLDSKKQEYANQKKKLSKTCQDLNTISDKIAQKSYELKKIEVREKVTLHYLRWYENLKNSLRNRYEIRMDEVFDAFARMINEFQEYDFDAINVIREYEEMRSIKSERNAIQKEIDDMIPLRDSLNTEIQDRKFDLMKINQTILAYHSLDSLGFGLKELKYLANTVREIAVANNIKVEDGVKKFLDDVEKDYDDKIGFEDSIKVLKEKKTKLEQDNPFYKDIFEKQTAAALSIHYTKSKGVTDSDIINISQFVHHVVENNLLCSYQSDETVRNNPWYFFTQDLKYIKNIEIELNNLITLRNKIKVEINDLKRKKGENDTGSLEEIV